MDWQEMGIAPRDGAWILAINNRGNSAVILWSKSAHDRGVIRPGWIHPFSTGELSPFWNGACGSHAVAWCALPHGDDSRDIVERFAATGTKAYFDEQRMVREIMNLDTTKSAS